MQQETKCDLNHRGADFLILNWVPDVKARKVLTVLTEDNNDDGVQFTWKERQAHCTALEEATSDTSVCRALIKVSEIKSE